MKDAIAIILTAALIFDALTNIARLISVEIAYKRHATMNLENDTKQERRIKELEKVLSPNFTISECSGCVGNGIDCADMCVKPRGI